MAQPFSEAQLLDIRARLIESARRRALTTGYKKTTLEELTADAGIAKSSFYKFFASKEELFLHVGSEWEIEILSRCKEALSAQEFKTSKHLVAVALMTSFRAIYDLGLARFLHEDLPQLLESCPQEAAKAHYMSSSELIFRFLRESGVRFTASDEVIRSVIQLLYLSMLNIRDIGDAYFTAIRELVLSSCDRLVA